RHRRPVIGCGRPSASDWRLSRGAAVTATEDHRPTTPLSEAELDALAAWPSPAIANAIETFDVRPRTEGLMGPDILGRFPELRPIVGYAVTAKIRASVPPGEDPDTKSRADWLRHIASVPGPLIVVMQDLDDPPLGSHWGEVNGNIHKAMGCVGVIADGGVRDLDEVRALGFQFVAKGVLVAHAYVHLVEIGGPVTVG